MMRRTKDPRSIVILRALQLGDLMCTVPAFRALRTAFPEAQITLVGLPWAKSFVERFSTYLDDFIEFPGWPGLPEQETRCDHIPAFLQSVLARQYDLAIQMQGSGYLTNPLISLFGAQETAGFYLPGQFCPNENTFMPYPEGHNEIHIFLELMKFLGIEPQGDHTEFPVTETERRAFRRMQKAHHLAAQQYICLHPGARDPVRRWSPEKFAAVGDALAARGYQIVLTGTQSEQHLTQAVAQQMRCEALDISGKTNMGTLALLLANARMLVSNDTGVSHIAAALKVPSVILFNPKVSEPKRWRPLNRQLHRVILNLHRASGEDVLEEVDLLLQEAVPYAN